MSAQGKVSFATLVHGITPAAKAQVSFAAIVHGPGSPVARAQVNFAAIVHGVTPFEAARALVSFVTLVHSDSDAGTGAEGLVGQAQVDRLGLVGSSVRVKRPQS